MRAHVYIFSRDSFDSSRKKDREIVEIVGVLIPG